jgi:hypothetical protein
MSMTETSEVMPLGSFSAFTLVLSPLALLSPVTRSTLAFDSSDISDEARFATLILCTTIGLFKGDVGAVCFWSNQVQPVLSIPESLIYKLFNYSLTSFNTSLLLFDENWLHVLSSVRLYTSMAFETEGHQQFRFITSTSHDWNDMMYRERSVICSFGGATLLTAVFSHFTGDHLPRFVTDQVANCCAN